MPCAPQFEQPAFSMWWTTLSRSSTWCEVPRTQIPAGKWLGDEAERLRISSPLTVMYERSSTKTRPSMSVVASPVPSITGA